MKLFNKTLVFFTTLLLAISSTNIAYSQCASFTKKQGIPALAPYTHNGQLTSTKFMPGDVADIEMTFNAGSDYRVLVLFQEVLGNVIFKVKDKTGKELFSSKAGDTMPFWDFRVNSTQQLIVFISVPEIDKTSNKIIPEGCVSVLVGFKPQENKSKVKMTK